MWGLRMTARKQRRLGGHVALTSGTPAHGGSLIASTSDGVHSGGFVAGLSEHTQRYKILTRLRKFCSIELVGRGKSIFK